MKSRLLVKSIWFEKEKDHILMTRNDLKSWKVSHNFSYILRIYENCTELWLKLMLPDPWMPIWKFECNRKSLTLFRMGLFGLLRMGVGQKRLPPKNLSHISYNNETWYRVTQIPYHNNETWCSYTLSKEVLKNI